MVADVDVEKFGFDPLRCAINGRHEWIEERPRHFHCTWCLAKPHNVDELERFYREYERSPRSLSSREDGQ